MGESRAAMAGAIVVAASIGACADRAQVSDDVGGTSAIEASTPVPAAAAPSLRSLDDAVALLDGLHAALTAAEWASIMGYDADSFETYSPSLYEYGDTFAWHRTWCLRASRSYELDDGTGVDIRAYFYLDPHPTPPADWALPAVANGLDRLRQRCRLGMMAAVVSPPGTETPDTGAALDSAAVRAATDAIATTLQAAMVGRFGPGTVVDNRTLPSTLRFGSAYFDRIAAWVERDVRVIEVRHEDGRSMFAGYHPAQDGPPDPPTFSGSDPWEDEVLDRAIATADPGPDVLETIRSLRASVPEARGEPGPPELFTVVRALSDAREPALPGSTTAERHSAGLLVADVLITRIAGGLSFHPVGGVESREARMARMEAVVDTFATAGARYWYNEIGGEYSYARSLLDSAVVVSPPPGSWGDRAALLRLDQSCPFFDRAIETAEELLGRAPDAVSEARLHLLLGDAHATAVALAMGAMYDYFPPEQYESGAEAARRLAIEHYRRAISGPLDDGVRRRAWDNAWRLTSRMLPGHRFACVYD